MSSEAMPVWLKKDPEKFHVELDIQLAAADGAAMLILDYDEETENVDMSITRFVPEEE